MEEISQILALFLFPIYKYIVMIGIFGLNAV